MPATKKNTTRSDTLLLPQRSERLGEAPDVANVLGATFQVTTAGTREGDSLRESPPSGLHTLDAGAKPRYAYSGFGL